MNYDTYDMTQGYYLMLNDEGEISNETGTYCRKDCTHHTLTVTSDVDQMVHIGGHIW